jgi:hypothetical protein
MSKSLPTSKVASQLYVAREHFSSYSAASQEEFFLKAFKRFSLVTYALETYLGSNIPKSAPEEVIANSPPTDSLVSCHSPTRSA